MAKKVTVTLVDDFDGEGAADETVEFGLDGVSYEIDLSQRMPKVAQQLESHGWRRAAGSAGAGVGRRQARAAAARRSIASKAPQSGSGRAGTDTTYPPAAGSPPTSSTHSTPQRNKQLPEMLASLSGSLAPAFASGELVDARNGKRFGRSGRC